MAWYKIPTRIAPTLLELAVAAPRLIKYKDPLNFKTKVIELFESLDSQFVLIELEDSELALLPKGRITQIENLQRMDVRQAQVELEGPEFNPTHGYDVKRDRLLLAMSGGKTTDIKREDLNPDRLEDSLKLEGLTDTEAKDLTDSLFPGRQVVAPNPVTPGGSRANP